MTGTLYLVPTPIGNLGDISQRCQELLTQADFIAAEDTRVTLRLLNHLGLKKSLVSYHEHNKKESGPKILARLMGGESCALVTDAGTPAISDPGEDLVALCAQAGVTVCAIPGPCAAVTGLSASGLPTRRFCFEGFLPVKAKERDQRLKDLAGEERTMIFYEAPHRLQATLAALCQAFGTQRPIALCRELTKLHEQILRTTLGQAVDYYGEHEPRGEFVLVLAGAPRQRSTPTLEDAIACAQALMEQGLSQKDAVKQAAKDTGFPKNSLYAAMVK